MNVLKESRGFKFAYVTLILLVLGRYFYDWLVKGNLDFYLLLTIVLSSILFVIGNILDKKE